MDGCAIRIGRCRSSMEHCGGGHAVVRYTRQTQINPVTTRKRFDGVKWVETITKI